MIRVLLLRESQNPGMASRLNAGIPTTTMLWGCCESVMLFIERGLNTVLACTYSLGPSQFVTKF